MRILGAISAILTGVLIFSSCQKPENTNPVPVISFKSFQSTDSTSGILSINFADGDGDIGYPSQDASAQPDLWVKFLYFDYTTNQYVGVFSPTDNNWVYYEYNVPYLTPAGKNKTTSGVIQLAMNNWYQNPFSTKDSIKFLKVQFQIWLFDRAGNKSNVITTPTLYPGKSTP